MEQTPQPPRRQKTIFHRAATFSLWAPLLGIVLHILMQPGRVAHPPQDALDQAVNGIMSAFVPVMGFLAGIFALFGMIRYGRAGILWKAGAGVVLFLAMVGTALPTVMKLRQIEKRRALAGRVKLLPAVHTPGANRITDDILGFSFELPDGYEAVSPDKIAPGLSHTFVKRAADRTSGMIVVKPMRGTVALDQPAYPKKLPPGRGLSLAAFDWRGVTVEAVRVPETVRDVEFITYNIEIPLKTRGIVVGVGGLAAQDTETRALASQVIATLEGETNW